MFSVRTDRKWQNESSSILRTLKCIQPWELILGFHTHHSRFARVGSTQQGQAVVEMVLVGSFKKLEMQTHRERAFRKFLPSPIKSPQRFPGKRATTVECKWTTRGYLMSHWWRGNWLLSCTYYIIFINQAKLSNHTDWKMYPFLKYLRAFTCLCFDIQTVSTLWFVTAGYCQCRSTCLEPNQATGSFLNILCVINSHKVSQNWALD